MDKIEILKSKNGKWYVHIKSCNGNILLSSEMYNSKSSAKKMITNLVNRIYKQGSVNLLKGAK